MSKKQTSKQASLAIPVPKSTQNSANRSWNTSCNRIL